MSSIPQGRRYNDTHRDSTSLAWLSICKQTEKDHNNPSSGWTDRSRSVSCSGAAKTPEPGRSDQPKYTAETASEILSQFGLDKNDLGELSAYSEDQITPENLKCILTKISINKKKRAGEKSSESQPAINLKSDLPKTPLKSNKVSDSSDFGSSVTKKETGKASTDKNRGKSLVETHKPSEDQLQRCVLKGKGRDLDSKTSRKSEISEQNKTVSPKHKPDEPKLCKPLSPKQQESKSKSSKASKPEHKRSNSKERKTQVKEKKHPEEKNPEVHTELKRRQQGQEKPVMQTKFKGSSWKNEPSHAIIRDCKGISPESFPHYCSICNKESRDMKAWCSHMKTTDHREKCKTLNASRSRSQERSHRRGFSTRSPCRRNASHSRSRSHGRKYRRSSGSPCRRNASRCRSRSHGRKYRRSSGSPCWRNASRSRSRSHGRKYRRSSGSPCWRNASRSRSRSHGRRYRRGSSSRSHSPYRQRRKSRSRSTSTSYSSSSEDRKDRCRSPPRSSYSYRHTLRPRSRSPRYKKSTSSFLLDHFLPPGSNSSQGPPLCSSQERCRPHLPGPHLLSWNNLLTPGSTSSLPCPPPISWVSRPSSFSRKEEELYSPGIPSERQLPPKSSSKNSPSPSRSGEKQTSGETSVPQDEHGAETLVKKLLQSSAVQSLSKQMDVESLVKTLTPIFLDEFNKLISTPGSSEAPQTESTAGLPPNHEPPVTSTEQKTATEMESEPSNKIEALNVKEKPKNETEQKCLAITPAESKPASVEKPAPVISSDDLTVGEKIEKCFDPKHIWPVEFTDSISEPELLITNLPNYHDGCYTEDDLVDLLRPFGFEKSSNIYVIPQKQLAIAFMPHVKGLKEALTQSGSGMFFKGSKLCLQACRIVTCWKPGKSTSLGVYKALMRCLKHNMTDNGEGIICIHHISPSETRELRTALRKIGSVRNFLPLLNKVFVEFESKHDADRLGVWYSFLKPGRKHTVKRLKKFVATSTALPPKLPAQALPDASDAVATARIPIANGVIKDCAVPPFWVTMSTAPYMFPTMSPWFDIPAFQTVKEVSDIKKALPQASQFSTIMLTGFPQSIRRQSLVAQLVSGYFTKGSSESVNVLSLQRRAFVFFPCWDSCHSFLEGYLTSKPSGKDFVLKVHLVLEDMHPGDTEETMYKNLMRWSNAHVSEPESLSQRLICVTFSDITLSIIQSFLMAVGSIAPFVNYLVLTDRIYIEMCDSSSAAQVLEVLMFNLLSEEEKRKKMSDCDQKKEEGFWRKRQNVYLFRIKNVRLVQRQPPAGGAVSGMAKAPDKIQPAGVQVEAAACEQQQTEAAEEEDVGTDSAEDRTENKTYTQQRQTPADESTKEEGEQEQELIDCVTDQEGKQEEKQKTAGIESEMRGGSAAKEDETTSGEDAMTAGGNKGEEEEKEASTKPDEVGAETADGSDCSSPGWCFRTSNISVWHWARYYVLDHSVNAAASGELEKTEQEVTSTRRRGRPRKKPRKTPVRKSARGKPESPEGNTEEDKLLPAASLDSPSSALLGDVKTETEDEAAEVLGHSVNAAAAGELEETEQTKQEVTSKRKGGRPRKKFRKTPVRKSAVGKSENHEENREEETKSLPGASLDLSSSALLGDVKTETEDEAAEAAGDLEETEKTKQEVTSKRKGGRPRKKPRKAPVRKSAVGKPENHEENREEETKALPEADAEGPDGRNLDGRLEEEEQDEGRCRAARKGLDQPVNPAAAGNLEEMEDTEQEVTSLRRRGRPRKKPKKTPVRKSAGGKPENHEENREEETKSLPGASLDPSSSALLGDVKTETEDEAAEGPDKQNLDGRLEEDEEEEGVACKKRRKSPCTAADFLLPPFNPDISCGEEFTARKLGYFCSLCSVFYVLKSNEEDTHCCSRNHYDNLLKHSQMKEEQPSPPRKTKTRRSR